MAVSLFVDSTLILSEDIRTYQNVAPLELASVVLEAMQTQSVTGVVVRCSVTDSAGNLDITFVAFRRPGYISWSAANFVKRKFLTLTESSLLPRGVDARISMWIGADDLDEDGTLAAECIYTGRDKKTGEIRTRSVTANVTCGTIGVKGGKLHQLYISRTASIAPILSQYPEMADCEGIALTAVVGARRHTWYFAPSVSNIFRFDNGFGVEETIALPCTVTSKLTAKASTAYIGRERRQYDRDITEEFTAEFGPLSLAQLSQVRQLASATQPRWNGVGSSTGIYTDIIVTGIEGDHNENAEELPSPKVKFQLRRPMLRVNDFPDYSRIHSAEFNNKFN